MADTPGEAPAQAGTGLAQCATGSQTAVSTDQRPSVGESPLHPTQPGASVRSTGLPAAGTGMAGAATSAETPPVDHMETPPIDQTHTAPTEPVVPTLTEPVVTAVADDEDDDGLPAWLWDRDTA